MKKHVSAFAALIAVTLIFSGLQISVIAESGETVSTLTSSEFNYTPEEYFKFSGGKITGYIGSDTEIIIPPKIGGVQVTEIGYCAFSYKNVTKIIIPEGVTYLGDDTFAGCSNLTDISLPDSIITMGKYAFSGCSSLKSIKIPAGLTSISYYAFYGCSSLASVIIPAGVTYIDDSAFYNCSSLKYVYFKGNKRQWNDINFAVGNLYLREAEIQYYYNNVGAEGICGDNVTWLLDDEGTLTISGSGSMENWELKNAPWYNKLVKNVIIENGVTSISNSAFYLCEELTSVSISDSVTSIGDRAFLACRNLTSITMSDNIKLIYGDAFCACDSLNHVNFTGNKDQWNTIIGLCGMYGGNECLANAEVHYNYKKIDLGYSYDTDNKQMYVTIECNDTGLNKACETIAAAYDTNGKLYRVIKEKTILKTGKNTLKTPLYCSNLPTDFILKIFIWSSADNMIPIYKSTIKNIHKPTT